MTHSPTPWKQGEWKPFHIGRKLYYEFSPDGGEVWTGVEYGAQHHCSEKHPGHAVMWFNNEDIYDHGPHYRDEDLKHAINCVNALAECQTHPTTHMNTELQIAADLLEEHGFQQPAQLLRKPNTFSLPDFCATHPEQITPELQRKNALWIHIPLFEPHGSTPLVYCYFCSKANSRINFINHEGEPITFARRTPPIVTLQYEFIQLHNQQLQFIVGACDICQSIHWRNA